jgi:gliding motility-associated-like protein
VSYTWNFGNGNTSQVVNPTQNYTNHGNFGVNLSAMSNMGCVASVTNPVVIYPLPVINFNGSNVCLGTGTSFFNNSSIPSGNIAAYSWDFDNNGMPDATTANAAYLYNVPGTYSVTLLATSNFGCVNVGTNTVAVYAVPTASFATQQNMCHGTANLFNNQSSIAAGNSIISYAWNFGDVSYSYQYGPQHTYFSPGTYSITLTVTSNNNCVSVYSATTAVHSLPNVNFYSNNACQNQSTQFNNTTIITGGTISKWRWDFQDDGIWDDSTNVNPILVYPSYGNFNCRLQAISNFQCSSQKVNPVIVYGNPIANFATKSTCLGDVTTFTNLSTSPGGIINSNQWDFNGDNTIDNIFASPTTTYSSNGVYLVKLEVQTIHGCTDVKSKSVYVNPKPVPLFAGKNRIGCPELCVSFTNSSTIATGNIVTTQWLFGDGSMPDYSQNPKHCYGTGNYNVTLKLVSDSGCISTMNQPSFVQVYPVPVAGFKVEPDEIDENEPNFSVKSEATDAIVTNYYINDGSTYSGPNFSHALKNADKAKPMVFQVVMNNYGCGDTTYKELNIKPSWVLYIPNTFTPNGDGVNDGFFAKGYNIKNFNLKIFDRWGHILFETNDINEMWDGTTKGSNEPIKQDIYVWKANVKDVFDKNHNMTGHVSLIK